MSNSSSDSQQVIGLINDRTVEENSINIFNIEILLNLILKKTFYF